MKQFSGLNHNLNEGLESLSEFRINEANVAALEEVQPSLHNPSDHYPVIADLAWEAETF